MKKIIKKICLVTGFTLPVSAMAELTPVTDIKTLIFRATDIAALFFEPLMFGISIVFLWGVVRFIWFADSDEKRAEGKEIIIWAVISFFVVIAIWGIIAAAMSIFNFGSPDSGLPFPQH